MNRSEQLIHSREIILHTYLYLISFLTVIGIIGNVLVIFVVTKFSKMQSITNIQIVSLACADFLHLCAVPQLVLKMKNYPFISSDIACKAYCFISHVNWFAGTLTLTAMSFDRFLAVIYPFSSQHFRSTNNAIKTVIITWILSTCFMIPMFINATVNTFNSTQVICTQKWPNTKAEFALLPTISYTFFFGYAMPGTLIFIFYLAIIYRLRKLRQKNIDRKNSITSSNKTTALVLSIVIVFLLCNLPFWINQWQMLVLHQTSLAKRKHVMGLKLMGLHNHSDVIGYSKWRENLQRQSMNFKSIMISNFCQMTSYLNSALNPILYSFLSAQFRTSFREIFGGKCYKDFTLFNENKSNLKYESGKGSLVTTINQSKRNNSNILCIKDKNHELDEKFELVETNV